MVRLLNAALSEGTKKASRRAVTSYGDFSKANFPTSPIFPAPTGGLAAFIAQSYTKHYAPTTLLTYMSALSYVHRLAGMPDPAQHFVIKKLLAGAQKLSGKPDTRLPISPAVLYKIVDSILFIVSSAYLRHMLQSMFLLTCHAFLRIGKITVHSRNKGDSVVQLGNVSISDTGILLVMSQFKHNTSGRPVTLSVLPTKDKYCPVHSLSQFLKGPLFAFANASLVSRNFFCQYLSKALQWTGLDNIKPTVSEYVQLPQPLIWG